MPAGTIGLYIGGTSASERLAEIQRAEELGIHAVWLNLAGTNADSLTIIAAAAARTDNLLFGTCIVPTWPRHPVVLAQQIQVIESLAPGRMRLGIGPGHRRNMESLFGVDWGNSQQHLREYVGILKPLLQRGTVDFQGEYYRAKAGIDSPPGTPVMLSALRAKGFALAGEIADGVIPWVSPPGYLRDVALPAVRSGARRAHRDPPPVIAYTTVAVHQNVEQVRAAARQQLEAYARIPNYLAMFADQGFDQVPNDVLSDEIIDAVVIHGDEEQVSSDLRALLEIGVEEIFVRPLVIASGPVASLERTLRLVASLAE